MIAVEEKVSAKMEEIRTGNPDLTLLKVHSMAIDAVKEKMQTEIAELEKKIEAIIAENEIHESEDPIHGGLFKDQIEAKINLTIKRTYYYENSYTWKLYLSNASDDNDKQ